MTEESREEIPRDMLDSEIYEYDDKEEDDEFSYCQCSGGIVVPVGDWGW